MTAAPSHLKAVAALVVVGTFVLGACGPSGAHRGAVPPSTTTTLPYPISIANSGIGGPFSHVGSVYRVSTPRLGRNRIAPPPSQGPSLAGSVVVAYRRFGSGPNLLLVSGEHSTMTSWDPRFLLDLAAHFTVTEFDFPDVGYSAPDAKYTSIAALADYTAGLIWALGLNRPTVLGWGLGGEVALSLVERHPGLVWRLVLADATPGGAMATQPTRAVANALASPLETPAELSYLEFPSGSESARATWLADTSKVTADVMTAAAVVHEAEVVATAFRSDVVAQHLGVVGVPTLIFQGGRDVVVPPANAYLLDALLPHPSLVVFEQAGYAALFENARSVVRDLENFTGP